MTVFRVSVAHVECIFTVRSSFDCHIIKLMILFGIVFMIRVIGGTFPLIPMILFLKFIRSNHRMRRTLPHRPRRRRALPAVQRGHQGEGVRDHHPVGEHRDQQAEKRHPDRLEGTREVRERICGGRLWSLDLSGESHFRGTGCMQTRRSQDISGYHQT